MELHDLPWAIAFLRERGAEFVIPLPTTPEPHIIRLFETLGVEWTVDPVRAEQMRDDIEQKWCPRCQEWGIAHDRTGLCLWCDGPMQDEPGGTVVGREEQPMSTTATAATSTRTCKEEGCVEPELQQFGMYGGLCAKHTAEKKRAQNADGGGAASTASATHLAAVRALVKPARKLDQAAARLARVPTNEKARAELAEAMRHVQASPTAANLERLAKATKAMSKDQPRRKKLQNSYDDAARVFKGQVAQLARDLAAA